MKKNNDFMRKEKSLDYLNFKYFDDFNWGKCLALTN